MPTGRPVNIDPALREFDHGDAGSVGALAHTDEPRKHLFIRRSTVNENGRDRPGRFLIT